MNSLDWYIDLFRDIEKPTDVVAMYKIVVYDVREAVARLLLDHTGKLGEAIQVEMSMRWHLARAKASGAEVYCVYHACDMKLCPAGAHDDE